MSIAPFPIVVAIPAWNEAERLGACLRALHGQEGAPPFLTVLLANNCTDGTVAIGRAWARRMPLEVVEVALPPALAHAGQARRLALQAALARVTGDGVLLTTDADTHAPPGWIAANLAALATGVDAVAGRAVIDPVEARMIPPHLHALDALECAYAALLDEIGCLLRPVPLDPWPRHDEHSGASIAVRRPAFVRAGGVPSQPTGEDRALFAALARTGARIRHAPEVWVTVSGRLDGRAAGGMAETIRARIARPPEWLDERLEPLDDRLARLRGAGVPTPMRRVAMADVRYEIDRATSVRDVLRAGYVKRSSRYSAVRMARLTASFPAHAAMNELAAGSPPVG